MNPILPHSHTALQWHTSLPHFFKGYVLPGSTVHSATGNFGFVCVQQYLTDRFCIRLYLAELQQVFIFQPQIPFNGLQSLFSIQGQCKWQPTPGQSFMVEKNQFTLQGAAKTPSTITLHQKKPILFEIYFADEMLSEIQDSFPGTTEKWKAPGIFATPSRAGVEITGFIRSITHCTYAPAIRSYF
jgi:hypothetical protein